jgi:omega-amidase
MARLTVALGEYDTGWHDVAGSLERARTIVSGAARAGAELVVLPEMTTTGFTMDTAHQAESRDGGSLTGLRALARDARVAIVGGVPIREGNACYNMAFLIDAEGKVVAEYRKQRVFRYAREGEHYTSGEEACVTSIGGVRVALLICFDLRYPELFRSVARDVDAVLLIANWPASRRAHWDALIVARAIENQCYVVAVNRTGTADGLEYDGGSVVVGPWGERLAATAAAGTTSTLATATVDSAEVARVRTAFPVLDGAPVSQACLGERVAG